MKRNMDGLVVNVVMICICVPYRRDSDRDLLICL
jgi:hypothetical protein